MQKPYYLSTPFFNYDASYTIRADGCFSVDAESSGEKDRATGEEDDPGTGL